jgi:regulator of sigma E protease
LPFLSASNLSAIPQFAIVLGIMVVVHELGHFIAAKLCGVRVEAFAIGFGKRLFGFVHNGTDYCVNMIPLGGYVKMTNEMPAELGVKGAHQVHTDDPGDFQNHPRWQRVLIAVAGPVANFILAFVLMAGLYMADDEIPSYVTQPAVADYVSPDSPIGKTGLHAGDRIVFFDNQENPTFGDLVERAGNADQNQDVPFAYLHDGKRVDTRLFVENKGKREDFDFEKLGFVPVEQTTPVTVKDLPDRTMPAAVAGFKPGDRILSIDNEHPHSVEALLAYLQDRDGKPSVVTMQRDGPNGQVEQVAIPITPYLGDGTRGKTWRLGFTPVLPPMTVVRLPFDKAVALSWSDNLKNSKLIFDVLHRLFTRQVSVKSLSSPIGMGAQVHEAFELGWFPLIATMAMISLNLGIFNLLPIPILDGGMILFLAIESLMRRDMNQAIKERVYQVAFVCLVLFAAVVIFNDITKYLPAHLKL